MSTDEQKSLNLYRRYLERETHRPEVRTAKQRLLRMIEMKEPAFSWPAFGVPAFALGLLFLWFAHGIPVSLQEAEPVRPKPFWKIQEEAAYTRVPSVKVKRLTSRVGPTMVYQPMDDKNSMTIIWVFAPRTT